MEKAVCMIIEGKNAVKEAIKSGVTISELKVQKGIHDSENVVGLAKEKGIRFNFYDKINLDRISETKRHQGFIAIAQDFKYSTIEEMKQFAKSKGENLFLLILDGVEDPHNVGSILRVADCSGAHGVILPKHRACSITDTVVKISSGASNYVKVAMVTNINDVIRDLKEDFVKVVCAEADGKTLYNINMQCDLAIVIGSEGNGVKPLTRKLCDEVISIPMKGNVNSLNASVATVIVAFEVIRQRQ